MIKEEVVNIIKKTKEEKFDEISLVNFNEEIPDEIFNFGWLKKLYLYGCPKLEFKSCFKLKNLNLLHIRLCSLNSFVGCESLSNLEELNLEGNNLIRIPNDLPKSIISLDISDNKLVSIDNIENLPNLIELYLINNQITEVPDFLSNRKLELIEIGNNNISKFPKLLVSQNYERMKAHKFDVHIYDNPFIKNLNLNTEEYILRGDWGYVNGLSNSEYLIKDFECNK